MANLVTQAAPLTGIRALPRFAVMLLVCGSAAAAGAIGSAPYLAALVLIAFTVFAGIGRWRVRHREIRPESHVVMLFIAVPLQMLLTAVLYPGYTEVVFLVCFLILVSWLVAKELVAPMMPRSIEFCVLLATTVVAGMYLSFSLPRLGASATLAWTGLHVNDTWINANSLVVLFLTGLCVALGRVVTTPKPWPYIAAAVVNFSALALTFSRSGYVALAVVLLVLALVRRKAVIIVGALAAVAYAMLPEAVHARIAFTTAGGGLDPSSSVRLDIWSYVISGILNRPLLGYGLHGLEGAIISQGGPPGYVYAHNTFLTLLAGLGLPLGILVLWTFARTLRRWFAQALHSDDSVLIATVLAWTGAAACSFFGEPFLTPVVIVPLFALVGAVHLRKQTT